VGSIDAAIARQWHVKHLFMAADTHTTIEEILEVAFCGLSMPRSYNRQISSVMREL
jgi:hypothetical protein